MPKAEILDPQGQAIVGALGRLGFDGVSDVRQGKRFELEVDDSIDDDTLAEIAESLLANTGIADSSVGREQSWPREWGSSLSPARLTTSMRRVRSGWPVP